MLDGIDRTSLLILATRTGMSFKSRYFAELWKRSMIDAGLQSVTIPGTD
jgi:hypothetical protein